MEITKAYFAKQADEITLQQADVVLVLQEEDGKHGQAVSPGEHAVCTGVQGSWPASSALRAFVKWKSLCP